MSKYNRHDICKTMQIVIIRYKINNRLKGILLMYKFIIIMLINHI
jgi:hypothetical protein